MKSLTKTALIAGAMGLSAASHAIVIDDFDGPTLTATQTGIGQTSNSDSGGIGTTRTLTAIIENDGNSPSDTVTASIDFGDNDLLEYSSGPNAAGAMAEVEYTGLGGFDLTNGGINDTLTLLVIQNNAPMDFTVELDDGTNTASQTSALPAFSSNFNIDFALAGFTGVDVTSIERALFRFDQTTSFGTDVQIDTIETVRRSTDPIPTPASLLLIVAGVGLLVQKRRMAA